MSQQPPNYPQPPYPGTPYYPGGGRLHPLKVARRASVLMWVLGVGCILFGLCGAALLLPTLEWVVSQAPPAQSEEMREQLRQLEAQSKSQGGIPLSTQLLITGLVIIAIGGALGILAFFVRGGSRAASITGAVFTGIVLGLLALQMLGALLLGGGAQAVMAICMMLVPTSLFLLLLMWLIQAARGTPQSAGMWQPPPPGYPPPPHSGVPQPAYMPPPHVAPAQPSGPTAPGAAGAPPTPSLIPQPPPGQPPVQFGYATRPREPWPSSPQQPAAADSAGPSGTSGSGDADEIRPNG